MARRKTKTPQMVEEPSIINVDEEKLDWALLPFCVVLQFDPHYDGYTKCDIEEYDVVHHSRVEFQKSFSELTYTFQEDFGIEVDIGNLFELYLLCYLHLNQVMCVPSNPLDFYIPAVQALHMGKTKYRPHAYKAYNGPTTEQLYSGIIRHAKKYIGGKDIDLDSGLTHLHAIMARVMMLAWVLLNHPQRDDRFKRNGQ